MSGRRHWIGVAAANHVARGRTGGFMQVNHGKLAPLKRISGGDVITYYAPVSVFGGKEALRAFVAIGVVKDGAPYQGEMASGFQPFRRDVTWLDGEPAPIAPLLDELSFTRGNKSWGYKFRFGLFEIAETDMQIIASAMSARLPVES